MTMEHTEVHLPELYSFAADISIGDGPEDYVATAFSAPDKEQAVQVMEALFGAGNVWPTGKGELLYCETELTLPTGIKVRTALQAKSLPGAIALLTALRKSRGMPFSQPVIRNARPLLVAVKAEIRIGSTQSAWTEILVDSTAKCNQLLGALFGEDKIITVWHKSI